MLNRILFTLMLVCSIAVSGTAQSSSTPCADLAKKHLKTLDKALDLDYKQMKCLKEKAVNFCDKNRQNPPSSTAQRDKRVNAFRKALLECLTPKQQQRVKTHFRDKRDEKARRSILKAFLEEFGDEVIIIKKRS